MTTTIEAGAVESALESAGVPFKPRERGWIVPAGGKRPCEVALVPEKDAMLIESVLIDWEEIGPTQRQALSEFLARAQGGMRVARCELRERQAVVTARLDCAEIEAQLPHALGAILAAGRMLSREAAALLNAEVAEGYLRFQHTPREIPEGDNRI